MAGDEDGRTPRRPSLKTPPFSHWKDKLRKNCYKRVQEDRARLLWKFRSPGAKDQCIHDKDFIKKTFQGIVADEFKKIKDSSVDEISGMTVDDALWEYDGLHAAYQGECEEILLEMQRIFYEDLPTEPATREEGTYIKNWEDEEDEYLASAVFEHMKFSDDQEHKVMWCPICSQGQLQDKYSLICCTGCEFKLKRDDEVSMDLLENRLVEAHTEHLDRGCKLKPKFCMKTIGLTALYIECQGCGTFEVVI